MENSRERLQRILSKFEKKIIVKDPDGEDFELIFKYPSIKNSEEFWDVIYTVMKYRGKTESELTADDQLDMIKGILPKIVNYTIKGYESEGEITDLEKEAYSSLIYTNTEAVINAFLDMSNRMLGSGDVPKNPKAEVLPTE